jgi:hypothetical protein
MSFDSKQLVRGAIASTLLITFTLPHAIVAQEPEHLVSPSALHDAAADASHVRQQNLDTLNQFFSTDKATQALQASQMSPQQVKSAVATLNDRELAQLASRASKAQSDFAAGNLNDRDLLIILVAIAALILIIVAVR